MPVFMNDTNPKAEQVLISRLRAISSGQKFRQTAELTALRRHLAVAGIKSRHPTASDEEIIKRLSALCNGLELTKKVYNWDPKKEGY